MSYKVKEGIAIGKMFDDVVGDLFSKKLYATTGKVDYNWDENAITFQSGGDISNKSDRIQWNVQLPHKTAIGSKSYFKMHMHWWQETVQGTFTLKYRIQKNGNEKTTSWTTLTVTTGTISSQGTYDLYDPTSCTNTCNQITTFPEIDISSCDISDTLEFQLARTDSNTGDIDVYYVDAHIAIDSFGSTVEWEK